MLLDAVQMLSKKEMQVKYLSGGEKQRVAIARALCNDPDLILADEPSGNLDRENSEVIHALLLDLCRKEQKGLIVATHDEQLAKLCDKTYLLENGILR
jgi:lipoprotein-releasing system ATP-binding protein